MHHSRKLCVSASTLIAYYPGEQKHDANYSVLFRHRGGTVPLCRCEYEMFFQSVVRIRWVDVVGLRRHTAGLKLVGSRNVATLIHQEEERSIYQSLERGVSFCAWGHSHGAIRSGQMLVREAPLVSFHACGWSDMVPSLFD